MTAYYLRRADEAAAAAARAAGEREAAIHRTMASMYRDRAVEVIPAPVG